MRKTIKNRVYKKPSTIDIMVDLTNAENMYDVYAAFVKAKLTQNELDTVARNEHVNVICVGKGVDFTQPTPYKFVFKKKPSLFKRFLRWIFGKKK